MKVLAVDDETMALRRLARLTGELLGDRLRDFVGVESLDEAAAALTERPFDVVLLDLNLSGEDGFSLLQDWLAGAFYTIVVSAQRDRAIEAFELGVTDFVPKPFHKNRLALAFERCSARSARPTAVQRLACRSVGGIEYILLDQVNVISADRGYSLVRRPGGPEGLCDKPLDRLEVLLAPDLLRVHRSHLIRVSAIVELQAAPGTRYRCRMSSGEFVPVGRTRIAELRQRLVR